MAETPVEEGQVTGRLLSRVGQLIRVDRESKSVVAESGRREPMELRGEPVEATPLGMNGWISPVGHPSLAWRWIRRSFYLVVMLPMLAMAGYTLLWATPRYTSEFRVAVRAAQPSKSISDIGEVFGLGAPSQTTNDANAVVQYLHSRSAVEAIEKRYPLRESFVSDNVDFFTRFHGKPDIEALTRHWNRLVESFYESSTSTIVVRVSAFSPADALKIANYLLADSEVLVNSLSSRARDDSVAFAQEEVNKAETRLTAISRRFQELQEKEAMFDPMKAAEANIKLASMLREQIAQRNAELATIQPSLAPDSPSVVAQRRIIAALRQDLAKVEAQATGGVAAAKESGDRPISHAMTAFQQLIDERTFAEKAHLSALTSLETARAEANRQQVYLAVVVPPGLPEEIDFPRPLRQIGLTAAIATVIWLVGLLGVYSIREHM